MAHFILGVVRQRAAVILLGIILLIAGILTAFRLQLELLPSVSFQTVTIITADPGASPNSVLEDVTKPIEGAVSGVPGIDTLLSTSAENASIVTVRFNYGVDINAAESKVSTAVTGLQFPAGVLAPKVSTFDLSAFPVLYVAATGRNPSTSLQTIVREVDAKVKPELEGLNGVASADVGGGSDSQVTILLHPDQMARYGVQAAEVLGILQQNNVRIPAGDVTRNGVIEPIVTVGSLTTLHAIRDLPISVQVAPSSAGPIGASSSGPTAGSLAAGAGTIGLGAAPNGVGPGSTGARSGLGLPGLRGAVGSQNLPPPNVSLPTNGRTGSGGGSRSDVPHIVRLRDVATVSQESVQNLSIGATPGAISGIVHYNGRPAVSITIRKNSDANIVSVANAVSEKLQSLSRQNPDLHIATVYDSSTTIKTSVSELVKDGLFGAVFAVLVIFIFLRTVRTTVVTALSIPLSIFTAIILLGSQGITLNIMTIGAIAVAVGRVVDDAIVVLENIYRHIQNGEDRVEAVVHGAQEVSRAILGSTITTVAVFLPIGFIGGILGQFFQPFAFTVTYALIASLVVALTVVPALGSLLIIRRPGAQGETVFQKVYTPLLGWSLRHRAATLAVAFGLFVASLFLTAIIPLGFFPASNETLAQLSVTLPVGSSTASTMAETNRLEQHVIGRQPGIQKWETIIGYNSSAAARGGNANSSNAATLLLVYKSDTNMPRALATLHTDLTPYLKDGVLVSGAAVSNGPPSNVNVQITGTDSSNVRTATQQVFSRLQKVQGITNIQSNLQARSPQIEVSVHAAQAFAHGLTPSTVALAVRQAVTGQTATTVQLQGQEQQSHLFVQVDPHATNSPSQLQALKLGVPLTRLDTLARVSSGYGPVEIARQGEQNIGAVTADVSDNADAGSVTSRVAKGIAPLTTYWTRHNVTVGQAGVGQQLTQGFVNMGLAMLIAIGLVYLIMVMLFRSLLVPFVILFSLPLAVIGALIGLAITHRQLDMSALIGFLMLIGIVVTNAIVLLDLVLHKIDAGEEIHSALMDGGRPRVRPMLMTATATILALMPLAFSNSGGTLIAANLATVVIGGLVTSTILTLVVVPVIFSLLMGLRYRLMGPRVSEATV